MTISSTYYQPLKDILDFVGALALIILTFPLQLGIGLILFVKNRRVLFIHRRPGLHSNLFPLIKFRTMNDSEVIGFFESFLRKTSLDELPQLYNIMIGQMSFIGPRPLLEEYLGAYSSEQLKRHSVKPGITGWAQVNGRNQLNLDEKVDYDLEYVNSISLRMDLKILRLTFIQVLKWGEADLHAVQHKKAQHA